jgi:hypothetical protein
MHPSSIAPTASAPRFNMYGFIHKALRAYLSDTLVRLGRMDVADAAELDAGLAQVRGLLGFCRAHLEHENRFVHPAMEARAPGTTAQIAGEHVHHEDDIALLQNQADTVEALREDASACEAAAGRLYRDFAVFVGANLQHMDCEEREHNAVLWLHYSDAELHAIEAALVASLAPAEKALALRWMIPSINHFERTQWLEGMRANAPAEAVAGALELARSQLDERDWHKLCAGQPGMAVAA